MENFFVQVLDAADFSKGPVAKLWLQHHVPHGLHGFFSPTYFGPSSWRSSALPRIAGFD